MRLDTDISAINPDIDPSGSEAPNTMFENPFGDPNPQPKNQNIQNPFDKFWQQFKEYNK